jgi:glycosyltransferase involved in cell wall biosynthesis
MMRVLHFRSSFTFAGPEAVLLNLAAPLLKRGVESKVILHYQRKEGEPLRHRLVQEIGCLGLEVEQWNSSGMVSAQVIGRLTQELVEGQFDLLHTHDPKANLMGVFAAHRARVPIVATVHLHDTASCKSRIYRAIDLQTLRFFPGIIAVSHALRQELIAAQLPAERIRVIHNGIDGMRFARGVAERARAWREQYGESGEGSIITTVGRLSPQKGMHIFLEAARLILGERPESRFWVVGSGPLRRRLEETARRLGIERATSFLGHRSDVAGLMAASDVIAMTSVREGLPMVLLEALALARPVVATAVGGIPEVIQDHTSGWLVPPNAPALLAERMLQIVEHPDRAASIGASGQARVSSEFSAAESARRLAQSYARLVSSAKVQGIEEIALEHDPG